MTREEVDKYLRIRSRDDGGCWIWTMTVNSAGHPTATIDCRRGLGVRRWAWEQITGMSAGRRVIGATCINKLCVNPEHLRLMSRAQNQKAWFDAGAVSISLNARLKRSLNGRRRSPLSEQDVQDIRARRAEGEQILTLSREFGVSTATIGRIVLHQTWVEYGNPFNQLRK